LDLGLDMASQELNNAIFSAIAFAKTKEYQHYICF